jgi:hypothetical protein
VPLSVLSAFLIYSQWIGEKFRENEKPFLKNYAFCGVGVAASHTVAHPMKQGIEHETVTEQTNRD